MTKIPFGVEWPMADFSEERILWRGGDVFVAGMDEVGRGCFAGPVVAGCVVFAKGTKVPSGVLVDDSKKLSAKRRQEAEIWIKETSLGWGVGAASAGEINKKGIVGATEKAFRRAVTVTKKRLSQELDFLLMDAFYVPYLRGLSRELQKPIKKGDGKSLSIAAGSILAKVYRDKYMEALSLNEEYAVYGWVRSKGYGTREHRDAIAKYGTTIHHRNQFVETWLSKTKK